MKFYLCFPYPFFGFCPLKIKNTHFPDGISLRGRPLKGRGKGVLGARETRGAREEGGREGVSFPPPRAPLAFLSHLKLPFPSVSNACHAGYDKV